MASYQQRNRGSVQVERKKGILMLISACQTMFGFLSIALGAGTFLYCRFCMRYSFEFQNTHCDWTFTMQDVWGGSVVAICGLAGIMNAFLGKRCCNRIVLIVSSLALTFALAACAVDVVRFLDAGWFRDSVHDFQTACLDDRKWVSEIQWDAFNILSISISGCCCALCLLQAILTGCVQYASASERNTEVCGSRSSIGYEQLPPPYSVIEDRDPSPNLSSRSDAYYPNANSRGSTPGGQSSSSSTNHVTNRPPSPPTVDDLICLHSDDEVPSTSTFGPQLAETHLRSDQAYFTRVQSVGDDTSSIIIHSNCTELENSDHRVMGSFGHA